MTYWNTHGTPLTVINPYKKGFKSFLKELNINYDEPLWEMNEDDEVWPVSDMTTIPEDYITSLKAIMNCIGKYQINRESGYSFSSYDEEHENRSVGGISTNDAGITFCKIDGNGKVYTATY